MSDSDNTGSDSSGSETAAVVRKSRRAVIGKVVSDKMDKTIIVRRDRLVMHPLYKKHIRRSTRLTAHDGDNTAHLGDEVEIEQTRPISKSKRWRLVRVLRAAPHLDVVTGAADANVPTGDDAAETQA